MIRSAAHAAHAVLDCEEAFVAIDAMQEELARADGSRSLTDEEACALQQALNDIRSRVRDLGRVQRDHREEPSRLADRAQDVLRWIQILQEDMKILQRRLAA